MVSWVFLVRIEWKKSAVKEAAKAPIASLLGLVEAVSRYAENPDAAVDVKALKGYANSFRVRKGDWRLVFTIADDALTTVRIAPRGSVYRRGV
jgi:mRNA-degrading endonuclease RelE of RelBE toxin-antitoxin system